MAKVQAKDVFNAGDLKMYNLCCEHYPKLMKYFKLNAEIQCFLRNGNVPDYFYVDIENVGYPVKLFASLSIADFYGKLVLLNELRSYIDEKKYSVNDGFRNLLADNAKMCAIALDIEEILHLVSDDIVESEYFDFEEHDTIDEGFERYELLSDFKSKTVH